MEAFTIGNEVAEFSGDGYLLKPELWTEEMAQQIASHVGIANLSENHWVVIHYVRGYWDKNRTSPLISQVSRSTRFRLDQLQALFPMGLARGACRIAGLPKPDGCV
ncbi:MAG: Sulfite reductase, dissimilatory-type subunit gamma [Syntrophorhabdus sp. PtaB.Bin047]|jgi:tRNA 2-thiouridine synthesizing protein E|nr:MAG: Sulfite reductase, dissimilatory-type subunit gamma [Syntrophorhabdus sp. PtaB.Bin047]